MTAHAQLFVRLMLAALVPGMMWISPAIHSAGPQASAATDVVLTVDASQPVYPFRDGMRGVATNSPNWLWHGLWDRGSGNPCCPAGKTEAIIDATSYIEPGVIRFAGGRWANEVGWSRDGSAPDDGPWTHRDPATGQTYNYTHAYSPEMVDAFADFREQLGAQAIIQVNVCDNNVKMWQDLVRYANIENDYDFEYWELGNEQTLDSESCGLTSATYIDRFLQYEDALKAVDPSVKVMGPATNQPYFQRWEDHLVDAAGADLDVLAWHWYQVVQWSTDPASFAYQGGSLASMMAYDGNVGSVCLLGFGCPRGAVNIPDQQLNRWVYRRGIVEQKMGYINGNYRQKNPSLKTAITEFGVYAQGHSHPVNGNHAAAVWLADVLARWAYNGLDMIAFYSLEDGGPDGGNSRGLLGINSSERLDVRPVYYTEYLYAQHFGDMMVQSDTSDPEKKVVVWASTDSDDPGKLKLMLVNLSGDTASTQIRIDGFTPVSGQAYVMASEDPTSMADPASYTEHTTTINGVKIPDYQIANPSVFRSAIESIEPVEATVSNNFSYTMQPYSVVALTLEGRRAQSGPDDGFPGPTIPDQVSNETDTPPQTPPRRLPAIGASSPTLCEYQYRLTGPCTD